MSDDRPYEDGHGRDDENRGAHPAGGNTHPPRVEGHIRGLSFNVDAAGNCRLVLHLENDAARSRHAVTISHEALAALGDQIQDCLAAAARIEALGAAADDALRAWDGVWVAGELR